MKPTTIALLQKCKQEKKRFATITAYDYSFAKLFADEGIHVLLVGDSLGMTVQGHDSTLPVTVEDITYHTRAVRRGAPRARLIVDANQSWSVDELRAYVPALQPFGVDLLEQPVAVAHSDGLRGYDGAIPVCADEALSTLDDLPGLVGRYQFVNIKLDKTGGLTEALVMKTEAERLGFTIMVGCMLGTSLGMAPAVLAAQGTAFADLDGPLLLAEDREPGLVYEGSLVYPARPELWG